MPSMQCAPARKGMESLIGPASKGDIKAMRALELHLREVSSPPPAHIAALFLRHLKDIQIKPDNFIQDNKHTIRMAIASLLGVQACCRLMNRSPELSDTVWRGWPLVWKWIKFLGTQCILRRSDLLPNIEGRSLVFGVVKATLQTLCEVEGKVVLIGSTPGVLEMVTKIWLQEAETDFTRELLVDSTTFSAIVAPFIFIAGTQEHRWMTRIVRATDGRPLRIVLALLQVIRRELARPLHSLSNLRWQSTILCALAKGNSPYSAELRLSLITRESLRLMMEVLAVATDQDFPTANSQYVEDIISNAILYLSLESIATDGVVWICQALDAHLLSPLLKAQPWLLGAREELRNLVVGIVGRHISMFVVHRPVVGAIGKALHEIDAHGLENMSAMFPEFRDTWRAFRILAKERLRIKGVIDGRRESSRRCSSKKCLKVDGKKAFKQCVKCHDAFYCSKECQREDWQNGNHRGRCKVTQELREMGHTREPGSSRKDVDFVKAVMNDDFNAMIPHIFSMIETHFPNDDPTSVITYIEQRRHPGKWTY
ncbi:hypothetical protein JAAARDRAFT_503143 [Jaapia argillacea MUCL 33604]|uniref:MYND-type domain-containing protein n=1 Tax=Jaapia argillacea MUCL 33604 TaxID=933084 RepID=A0A067PL05_9AGAM|nr:hypothetical protein JAAARDRAFT_503143 [Jaapia argillacea MUCL 33604]